MSKIPAGIGELDRQMMEEAERNSRIPGGISELDTKMREESGEFKKPFMTERDYEMKAAAEKADKSASGVYVGQPSMMSRFLAAQSLSPIEASDAENDRQMG